MKLTAMKLQPPFDGKWYLYFTNLECNKSEHPAFVGMFDVNNNMFVNDRGEDNDGVSVSNIVGFVEIPQEMDIE